MSVKSLFWTAYSWAEFAVNLVLPPRCMISGQIVDRQGMIAASAWSNLSFIRDPFCQTCGTPFEYEVDAHALCAHCLNFEPAYDSARAALVYNEYSSGIILAFKHGDRTQSVRCFTPWLKVAGKEFWEKADYIVPVPLHRWRLLKRRYNQSVLLCRALEKEIRKRRVRHIPDLLIRTKHTKPQGRLKQKDRRKNVRKAFAVRRGYSEALIGKVIVLVDDVYTTGSTANECAKTLKAAGAKEVHVLTIARTVKD